MAGEQPRPHLETAFSHEDEPQAPATGFARYAEVLVALGVLVLGIVILVETRDIRVAKMYSKVGPRVIPTVVGWGLVVLGAWYAVDVLRGDTAVPSGDAEDVDPTLPADWRTLAGLGIALAAYAALMNPLGYVIASTVLFVLAAISMGSRHFVRDTVIALITAIVTYYAFRNGLNIRLPQGLWF